MKAKKSAIVYAVAAAVLYGISAPLSKLLLGSLSPAFLAALLYLGAGAGMLAVQGVKRLQKRPHREAALAKKDFPFVAGMVLLDIAAPILLMMGLSMTNAATVSLLNNFEIVATAMVALLLFREAVGLRMWLAIGLITAASVLLSVGDLRHFNLSPGALLALLACVCWGFENNCTRMLSLKDPVQIVVIKGLGSGFGALIIAGFAGAVSFKVWAVLPALLLGFVSYGLSITFYIHAQRGLGAARTSAFYAVAPFIGVALSFGLFGVVPGWGFAAALGLMALGAYLAVAEKHAHAHTHEEACHDHRHSHNDGHHTHAHEATCESEHCHEHTHEPTAHAHPHLPDMHHGHSHE